MRPSTRLDYPIVHGVPPTLEDLNIGTPTDAQNQLLRNLIMIADPQPRAVVVGATAYWDLILRAGVYEIGRQCDQYLDVLVRFNREQRVLWQDLTAAASGGRCDPGTDGVSSKATGITAALKMGDS
jgi:hypothetical protein